MIQTKTKSIEEKVEAFAEDKWTQFAFGNGDRSEHYTTLIKKGANFAIPLAREEGRTKGWREAIEFLMDNAGNYCDCKNAYGELCSKHAQTHSAHILKDEAERLGILPKDE